MMRLIRQKHKSGCAIACIAMLTNRTYDEAMDITLPNRKPRQRAITTLNRSFIVLSSLGLKPLIQEKVNISSLKNPAMLTVNCGTKKKPYYHAVIWDPESKKILDPYFKKAWPRRHYQRALQFVIEIKNKIPSVDSSSDND